MKTVKGLAKQEFVREPYEKVGFPGIGDMPELPEGMVPMRDMPAPAMQGGEIRTDPFGVPEKKETTAALEVVNGQLVRMAPEATGNGDSTLTKDLRLRVHRDDMGGIYAAGEGTDLTVEHANIHISGEGTGLGGKISGAYVEDHAKLTLRDCRIHMDGILRCATSAADHSLLKVYDSTLISHGEPWPADTELVTRVVAPGMAAPPYTLEVEGNMRTHCTVGDSESYFYNSTIIADGWVALSTDAAGDRVYLEANDCRVITTRSGYGTYADGGCWVVLNRCDLDVANMAAICGGEAGVTLNDCTAKCGNYVVLAHVVGMGGEKSLTHVDSIEINGGFYRCENAAVILKSCNADVLLNHAEIRSHDGILLQSVYNDFCAPRPNGKKVYGYHVVVKDMDAQGDILHQDPERIMEVRLENARLTGAITGGALLNLDKDSFWTATGDSDVVLNGDLNPEQIDAPAGVTIRAKGGENADFTLKSGGRFVVTA